MPLTVRPEAVSSAPETRRAPVRTMPPSIAPACTTAARRRLRRGRDVSAAQYCLAIIATRNVRNALVAPPSTEVTNTVLAVCSPGTLPATDPNTPETTGWTWSLTSRSSSSPAMSAVAPTLAYRWTISRRPGRWW